MTLSRAEAGLLATGPTISHRSYYSWVYVTFLLVTLTGLSSLRPRQAYANVLETGEGDLTRQLVYIGFLLVSALPIALGRPKKLFTVMPTYMVVLFAWCACTLLWSPVPDIGLRKLLYTIIVAFIALIATSKVDLRRGISLTHSTLFWLMIGSLAVGLAVPSLAIHQPGDPESGIIGNWRGLFYHKNLFGAVAAVSLIFAVHHLFAAKKSKLALRAIMIVVPLTSLALSSSKTSFALGVVASLLFLILRPLGKRRGGGALIGLAVLVPAAFALLVLGPLSGTLDNYLDRPEVFTGRGLIWSLVGQVWLQNPIFGIGYQSIYNVGQNSALASMASSSFIQTLSYGHNSYLDLAASIGVIGLGLALIALVWAPMRSLRFLPDPTTAALFGSVLFFVVGHSMLETTLLARDSPVWVVLVCMIGMLRENREQGIRDAAISQTL